MLALYHFFCLLEEPVRSVESLLQIPLWYHQKVFFAEFSNLKRSMSLKVLSRVLKHNLLAIGASSHMSSKVLHINSANWLLCFISNVDSDVNSISIWNFECTVRPFGSNKAVMPEVTIGSTIFDADCNLEIIAFYKYAFPIPL